MKDGILVPHVRFQPSNWTIIWTRVLYALGHGPQEQLIAPWIEYLRTTTNDRALTNHKYSLPVGNLVFCCQMILVNKNSFYGVFFSLLQNKKFSKISYNWQSAGNESEDKFRRLFTCIDKTKFCLSNLEDNKQPWRLNIFFHTTRKIAHFYSVIGLSAHGYNVKLVTKTYEFKSYLEKSMSPTPPEPVQRTNHTM